MSMLRLCLAVDLGSSSRRYTKVMKGYERSTQMIEFFNNPVLGWQIHCNGGWLREGCLRLPEQLISKEGRPCCYWWGRKTFHVDSLHWRIVLPGLRKVKSFVLSDRASLEVHREVQRPVTEDLQRLGGWREAGKERSATVQILNFSETGTPCSDDANQEWFWANASGTAWDVRCWGKDKFLIYWSCSLFGIAEIT